MGESNCSDECETLLEGSGSRLIRNFEFLRFIEVAGRFWNKIS